MAYIPFSATSVASYSPYANWIDSFQTGAVLYYVIDSKSGRGYVGQSQYGLGRLAEHIIRGYSDPGYHSGAATIIRDNTCRNTYFRYFTASSYFGVPETLKYFLGISTKHNKWLGHWEYRANSIPNHITSLNQLTQEQLLDIAEVIHIIYNHQHNKDLSSENIKSGGSKYFKIFYTFSDYEIARICAILSSLGVYMSPARLKRKISNYQLTSQDLAENTLKVIDPVSDVLIRELLEQDILSQIVQTQDFIDELKKACYTTSTFKTFVEKNVSGHATTLRNVSASLNTFLQQKLQKIIENVFYRLGNYNINVTLSTENDFDFTSLLRSIGQVLQSNVKGKKFNSLDDALTAAFKTQSGQFRSFSNFKISHKFYANVKVNSSSTDAPWLKAMDADWAARKQYAISVDSNSGFSNWIKAMSFIGFYQNYMKAVGAGNNIVLHPSLMDKIYQNFKDAGVHWGWAWEYYYRRNITLLQNLFHNPLEFDFSYQEIETAFSNQGDWKFVHAWPTTLSRAILQYRSDQSLQRYLNPMPDGKVREYLFLEQTARNIQDLQGIMTAAAQLTYY